MSNTVHALEGLKVEPTTSIKMDTSLEHTLPKQSESSNLSCSSSSDSIDDGSCHHKKILSQGNYDTCISCGAYVPKNGVKNFKSAKGTYSTHFPPKTIYETMTRRSAAFNQTLNPEYIQIRQNYVEWVLELAEKLRISANSSHLAILLLDTVLFKDPSLTSKLQLFAPICLLVAAKTIELDERIPYIPKLRRYAGSNFSVDEYTKAELHVLDLVDWNPQFSSPIEIIEFFMCQGFLFSNDVVVDNNITVEKSASPKTPAVVQKTETTFTTPMTVTEEVASQIQAETEEKVVEKKETEETATLTVTKENSEVTQPTLNTINEIEDHTTANTTQQQPVQEDTTEATPSTDIIELPKHIGLGSGSLIVEDNSVAPTPKNKKLSERRAKNILAHFESSYTKILTYILREVEFLEFEPRVIASAVLAFFRTINHVAPWNDELDAITNLKFEQVSRCLEIIQKKYTIAFDMKNVKPQNVLSDLQSHHITNTSSIMRERIEPVQQPQPELKSRTNLINNGVPNKQAIEANFAPIETKLAERKPTFTNYQPKNVTTTILPTAYNYIRDDLRLKSKTATGTFNSEIPMRNPMKSALSSNYQVGRTGITQEQIPGMHTSVHAALGRNDFSALANHPGLGNDSYIKRDQYGMGGVVSGHTQLTSENRLPYHMKGTVKK